MTSLISRQFFTKKHGQSTNALIGKIYMNQSAPIARLRLGNQVAVVTVGTRGIGEGIVRRFVEEGAKVVFSGRSSDKGKLSKKN
jgi:3-oxoacyl-ACP reductase-like protein